MKPAIKVMAVCILLFNGITAGFGGIMLMYKPDGSALDLSPDMLANSPFSTFLVPGIILFSVIGLLSFWIARLVIRNHEHAIPLLFIQGCILLMWLVLQIIMIQTMNYLQLVYASAGLLLIISALMLSQKGVVT